MNNQEFIPILLGSDRNVYGMAVAFHEEYNIRSISLAKCDFLETRYTKIIDLYQNERIEEKDIFIESLKNIYNKYKDKKLTSTQIALQSETENAGYQAGELIVPKNEASANGLGMTLQNLLYLFTQNVGFCSEIQETEADYRFISIINKYDAKMLGISDIVQPDTTVTVYEYIRSSLAQQKQQIYMQQAAVEISKQLNVPENVERKKTGDALDKLLNWGE